MFMIFFYETEINNFPFKKKERKKEAASIPTKSERLAQQGRL
jgi:hypothetical protein